MNLGRYVYEGAFASGVKKVKLLSLFSLAFTSIGGPLLVIGDSAATAMQWGMAGAVVFFGTSTTGLLHMITSPYVLSLRRLADGSFEAVKPLLTGGETVSRFRTEDIQACTARAHSHPHTGACMHVRALTLSDVVLCSDIQTRHGPKHWPVHGVYAYMYGCTQASSMPFETFKAQGPGQKLQGYYIHKELFLGDEGQDMLCQLLGVEAAEDMYVLCLCVSRRHRSISLTWKTRAAGTRSSSTRIPATWTPSTTMDASSGKCARILQLPRVPLCVCLRMTPLTRCFHCFSPSDTCTCLTQTRTCIHACAHARMYAFIHAYTHDPKDAKVALLELGRELAHEADK